LISRSIAKIASIWRTAFKRERRPVFLDQGRLGKIGQKKMNFRRPWLQQAALPPSGRGQW